MKKVLHSVQNPPDGVATKPSSRLKSKLILAASFLILFQCITLKSVHAQNWQLINSPYATDAPVIAAYNVQDYGASGDGITDVTGIFQHLMDSLGAIGGGTLFAPSGKYVIRGSLIIPKGVTLRGEWQKPVKGQPITGTILMAYVGRGNEDTTSFVTMQPETGIMDLSIWYPEQKGDNITPYSPTILFGQTGYFGNEYSNAQNITLVNSYTGLIFNQANIGGCPIINGLYGTPLSRGIEMDNIADVGHIQNIDFSPAYWAGSGLPDAPLINSGFSAWINNNGTGIIMRRNDWTYTSFASIDGYHIGFHALPSVSTIGSIPNGQNYQLTFSNCNTGILCESAGRSGMIFSNITTTNCETGFRMNGGNLTNGTIQFYASNIQGNQHAAYMDTGTLATVIITQSKIMGGTITVNGGTLIASSNKLNNNTPQITLGIKSRGIITGNTYQNNRDIQNNSQYISKIDDSPLTLTPLPAFPDYNDLTKIQKPARNFMYLATAAPFGAVADGITDNTSAIQNALDHAKLDGGGTVFLPPGKYACYGHLSIPSGVALTGAADLLATAAGQGSILEPHADSSNATGTPFITMNANAGLRGLTINYPGQLGSNMPNVATYPYAIQGNGSNIYIVNVAFRGVYDGIDFATHQCNDHYISGLTGHTFNNVIKVGAGSTGGVIANAQFNPLCYGHGAQTKFGSWPNAPADSASKAQAYAYNYDHTYFLKLGNCSNETLYNNFEVMLKTGIEFNSDGAGGPAGISIGSGFDGSRVALQYNGLGTAGFNMYNSQLVSVGPDTTTSYIELGSSFNGTARLFNTACWGSPGKTVNGSGSGSVLFENANLQNTGSKRFLSLSGGNNVSIKNATTAHNNNMLLPGTDNLLSSESGVMDINTLDTSQMALYKNVLGQDWTVSLDGALDRTGWQAWANANPNAAGNALDSNMNTRWTTSAIQSSGQSFGVDMKTNNTLHSVVLDQGSSSNDFPAGYQLYLSSDSSNFGSPVATGTGTKGMTLISFPETSGRYIKIVQTGSKGGYWSIHEFYAFGKVNVDSVSLNKDTLTMDINNLDTLQKIIYPLTASNQSVAWGSSQPGIATVDTNGVVKGIAAGTAVIKIHTIDGQKTDSVIVRVNGATGNSQFGGVHARYLSTAPNEVRVLWNMRSQQGIAYYNIERADQQQSYNFLYKLSADRSNMYKYTDSYNLVSGRYTYRIAAVYADGHIERSDTATIQVPMANLAVYPNPVQGNQFNLKFDTRPDNDTYRIFIYNISGNIVYQSTMQTIAGQSIYAVRLKKRIPKGYYIIRLTNKANQTYSVNTRIE